MGFKKQRLLTLPFALWLASCSQPAPQAPPPPAVDVIVVSSAPIGNIIELPGRVQAVRTAEVRARVDGIVERRLFEEGSYVRQGQILYRIDPRERRADYQAALATLQRNEATALNAAQVVQRYRPLVGQLAISKQEYDAAVADARSSQANVANARAQVDRARLALSYTSVTAPISGQTGRSQITEGALVSASGATLLTTIEQLDTVYVNFSNSSSAVLDLRQGIASGSLKAPDINQIEVSLVLENGQPYGPVGHMDFAAMAVDQATGTVALRAQFPNPGRVLLPGQFVRTRAKVGVIRNGVQVPQRSVILSEQGASVMLVGPKNIAVAQPVVLGSAQNGMWAITSGLKLGDRVIVNGLQKVRPGSPVTITPDATKRPQASSQSPAKQ